VNIPDKDSRNVFIALAILFITNPIIYYFNATISNPQPDSATYMALADRIIENGTLYLHGWVHIDNGLILPPIYPTLIALTKNFSDIAVASQWVSSFAILASIIPIFLYVRHLINIPIALITSLTIQLNFLYLYYGTAILTEATFIFFFSIGLIVLQKTIKSPNITKACLLGLIACLLFLTRQIGIFFIFTAIPLILILNWQQPYKYKLKVTLACIVGFCILFIPYSIALYNQTQKTALTQQYRMNLYTVESETDDTIYQETKESYSDIFIQRRENRRLLPDSTEMYGQLLNVQSHSTFFDKLDIIRILNNGIKNFQHISNIFGYVFTIIFILSLFSSIFIRTKSDNDSRRLVIPVFIISYIAFVSLFTGSISRYIDVIFPFIIVLTISELYFFSKIIFKITEKKYQYLCYSIIVTGIIIFMPSWYFHGTRMPLNIVNSDPLYQCRKLITNKASIFSIHPGTALTLGGTYRVLPNDNFEKITEYARKTNVNWLALSSSPADTGETGLYNHSDWLKQGIGFEKEYPELIDLRCLIQSETGENISALYRFKK
jgi:4-amino-4-deoxy-L-arabinose transferase-like glycosyltransferase